MSPIDRSVGICAYDHVGIRVTDREVSIAFYQRLGFAIVPHLSNERVAELVTGEGVRINLIFNGEPRGANVLMDEPRKWPGYTHAAFIVPDLGSVLRFAEAEGIRITEGPVDWGRRITCFLRDPDGNVLEFNQLTGTQ
jgi:catechol 2,3-dioxygenase-like lactoylglutathione lyase family enzyme